MKTWYMGDTHGDWKSANHAYDRMANIFGTPDLLVQVGDYGFYPDEGAPITHAPFGMWERDFDHPCYFIDGNHEDHAELWRRCSGYRAPQPIDRNWIYMPRGTVWKGVLYVGGAASIDKEYRLRYGWPWSKDEELTRQETAEILAEEYGRVHTIVSHTFPTAFDVHDLGISGLKFEDPTTGYLEQIRKKIRPRKWFFGHMHGSKSQLTEGTRWRCLDICEIWVDDDT